MRIFTRALILLIVLSISALLATNQLFSSRFVEYFKAIAEFENLFSLFLFSSFGIGIIHLFTTKSVRKKEFLLVENIGPIVTSPLMAVSNGIFIYSGIEVVYIVCFDIPNNVHFSTLGKISITISVIAIMSYSLLIMTNLIMDTLGLDIKKGETSGRIINNEDGRWNPKDINTS